MKPPLRTGSPDDFQTPPEALEPLLAYLKPDWSIWEPAMGKGNLYYRFLELGFNATGTDILFGADFLNYEPATSYDCIVTNPPFKYKQQFLERCYQLGKPFALLLPLTALETKKRQRLFEQFGLEIILLDRRLNFETPNKVEKSSAWFATAWFTNGLNIGKQISYAELGGAL